MSVLGKQWYREEFLKSDEWRDFRLQVLVDCQGQCCVCHKRDESNDVHHVWYGEPSFTGMRQFVVLCRKCHDIVHSILMPFRARTELERQDAWERFSKIAKRIRGTKAEIREQKRERKKTSCNRCHSGNNPSIIDPIKQKVCDEHGRGRMLLCVACFEDLKIEFPHRVIGNSAGWKMIREFMKEKQRDEKIPFDLTNLS